MEIKSRFQIFWDVMQCSWGSAFRAYEISGTTYTTSQTKDLIPSVKPMGTLSIKYHK